MRPFRVLRKIGVVVAWLIGALVILVVVLWFRPTWTPSIREQGQTVKGSIASLETVDLNGVEQDVLIRGKDPSNPILLFLHGGPGMPAMYLAHSFQRDLEQDFVVVQWDRRGAGRTFCRDRNVPMSVSQEIEDTHALIKWLHERFHQPKIFLVGHSYGSYLGMLVAQRYPQLLYAYVGVGQLAYEGVPNQQLQDQFIERMARQSGDEHVLTEIKTGHFDREALLFRYGAEVHKYQSWWPLLGIGFLAPEYNLRYAMCVPAGVQYSQTHLRRDVIHGDLIDAVPELEIPVYFFNGRYDYTDPRELSEEYFQSIQSPYKEMVRFENSAHFPFLEEPVRFAQAMREVRDKWRQSPMTRKMLRSMGLQNGRP